MKIRALVFVVLLLVAAVVGAGGMLMSTAINHYTSTESFCTSCHTMTLQSGDSYYQRSAHRSNSEGVRPSCGDCHIPTTNWFLETYVHLTSGIRDVYVELTNDFSDPKTWEARRVGLEQEALANLRGWNSSTCRKCHDANAIQPKSDAGKQSHAVLQAGGVTCIDCHLNLVHPPAAPAKQSDAMPGIRSK